MLLKITLKFIIYCGVLLCFGCNGEEKPHTELTMQRIKDSVSEARIDSAYALIKSRCDTLLVNQVPKMVNSILKDTALLKTFFDSIHPYTDADKKVEKVIRQLQAECDSNLLRETYKRVLLQQKAKRSRHKR